MACRLAVILAGLDDAVALLELEFGLGSRSRECGVGGNQRDSGGQCRTNEFLVVGHYVSPGFFWFG